MLQLIVTITVQALVSLASLSALVMAPDAAATIGIPTRYVGVFIGVLSGAAYFSGFVCCGRVARYGASQAPLVLCAVGLAVAASGLGPMVILAAVLIGLGYGPALDGEALV